MAALGTWWRNRPIVVKLGATVLVAFFTVAALVGVGVSALSSAVDRAGQLESFNGYTREALEADMAHDAVRGDVLRALLVGANASASERDEIRADLADPPGRPFPRLTLLVEHPHTRDKSVKLELCALARPLSDR